MKRLLQGNRLFHDYEETVNPMESVANLADIMIVLAVGIMLALIMHWNVDVGVRLYTGAGAGRGAEAEDALLIEGEDIEEVTEVAEQVNREDMEKLGAVYFDRATGKYYIISE